MALTSQANKLTVFKPTDIQGCAVWFDAYDSTTVALSGTSVTSWQSKGYNKIQATASGALSPTYSNYTPGNPALYFNGANKMTTGGATYGTTGMTWITASIETVRVTKDAAVVLATLSGSSGGQRAIRYNVLSTDANIYTINPSEGGTLRQLTGENTSGIRGFIDTAATLKTYVNGTATTFNTAVTYQSAVNQGFQLGQWNLAYLTGYIFECIVYDTALSLSDYQKVEGYLAWKWGFQASLAAGHPYLTNTFAPLFPHRPYTIPMVITQTKVSVPPYSAKSTGQMNRFNFPPALQNCVLWLDATDVNGTGTNPAPGAITSWTDKSGIGNSSTAVNGTPTLTTGLLNNKPGIVFNPGASTSYVQIPRVITNSWSIFIVFSTTSSGIYSVPTPGGSHTDALDNHWWGGQGILDGEVAGVANDFGVSLCGGYLGYGGGNTTSGNDTTEFSAVQVNTGAGFIGEFFRTDSSGLLQMYVNGSFQVSTTASINPKTSPTLKIGSIQTVPASAYCFTGTIYEIIAYTRVLTPTETSLIEGYLAWKWGRQSTLPTTHKFVKYPPIA